MSTRRKRQRQPVSAAIADGALKLIALMADELCAEHSNGFCLEHGGTSTPLMPFLMFHRHTDGMVIRFLYLNFDLENDTREIRACVDAGYDLAVICVRGPNETVRWASGPGYFIPPSKRNKYIL